MAGRGHFEIGREVESDGGYATRFQLAIQYNLFPSSR